MITRRKFISWMAATPVAAFLGVKAEPTQEGLSPNHYDTGLSTYENSYPVPGPIENMIVHPPIIMSATEVRERMQEHAEMGEGFLLPKWVRVKS